MPKFPTITDATATIWNLPNATTDSVFDVYKFNVTGSEAEVAYSIVVLRNEAATGIGSNLNILDVSLNASAIERGFSLQYTDGSVEIGTTSMDEGRKDIAPETDFSSTPDTDFTGADRIVCVPISGDVTIDNLGENISAGTYRIVPLYSINYLTATINTIPDNSYAAFVLKFEPSEVWAYNDGSGANAPKLTIETSGGSKVINLGSSSFNELVFDMNLGVLASGSLNDSTPIVDGTMIDLKLWPVKNGNWSYSDPEQSFYAMTLQDTSSNPGGWKVVSQTLDAEALPNTVAKIFEVECRDSHKSLSVYNSSSSTYTSLDVDDLGQVDFSGEKVIKRFRPKDTSSLPEKSSAKFVNPNWNELQDASSSQVRMSYKHTFNLQHLEPESSTDLFTRIVYPSGGYYRRMTMPASFVDNSTSRNYVSIIDHADSGVSVVLSNSDSLNDLMEAGANYNLDVVLTYNNFAATEFISLADHDSTDFQNFKVTGNFLSPETGKCSKYIEISNVSDATTLLDSGGSTPSSTIYSGFDSDQMTDESQMVALRVPVVFGNLNGLSLMGLYGSISNPLNVLDVEGDLGVVQVVLTFSPEDSEYPFKYLASNNYYRVSVFPKKPSLSLVRKSISNSNYYVVNDEIPQVSPEIQDDGTSLSAGASWYKQGTTTAIGNTSQNWDTVDNLYVGAQGVARSGINGEVDGTAIYNPYRKNLVTKDQNAIRAFKPYDNIHYKAAKFSSSDNKWYSYFDFGLKNDGDYIIAVKDISVASSSITDGSNVPHTVSGNTVTWGVKVDGFDSDFVSTSNLRNNISAQDQPDDKVYYWGSNTDFSNAVVSTNNVNYQYSDLNFSVKMEVPTGASVHGFYYAEIVIKYYMDTWGNRNKVEMIDGVHSSSPKDFHDSTLHEARFIVKSEITATTNFQVSDSDDLSIESGSSIEFTGINIG